MGSEMCIRDRYEALGRVVGQGSRCLQNYAKDRTATWCTKPPHIGRAKSARTQGEKNWGRKLNQKERRLARDSALSATTDLDMVSSRGHRVSEEVETLPIILGNYVEVRDGKSQEFDIESFNHGSATRKVLAIFDELGLGDDLQRARNGRKIRAGKATMRGRVHKTPKSVLLVVKEKSGLAQAARNLPGVDVVAARDLNAEDLAPGGDVGRLTVFTKTALEELN